MYTKSNTLEIIYHIENMTLYMVRYNKSRRDTLRSLISITERTNGNMEVRVRHRPSLFPSLFISYLSVNYLPTFLFRYYTFLLRVNP